LTQAFLAHRSRLRQHAVLVTTRLYVPEVHFSALTILPYDMLSKHGERQITEKPVKKFSIGVQ
jgi:hypothetical protein